MTMKANMRLLTLLLLCLAMLLTGCGGKNEEYSIPQEPGVESAAPAEPSAEPEGGDFGTPAVQGEASGQVDMAQTGPEDYPGEYTFLCLYVDITAAEDVGVPQDLDIPPQYVADHSYAGYYARLDEGGTGYMLGDTGKSQVTWSVSGDGELSMTSGGGDFTGSIRGGILTLEVQPGMSILLAKPGADTSGIQPITMDQYYDLLNGITGEQDTESRISRIFATLDPDKGIHIRYRHQTGSSDSLYETYCSRDAYYASYDSGMGVFVTYYRDGALLSLREDKTGTQMASAVQENACELDPIYSILRNHRGRSDYSVKQIKVDGADYDADLYPATALTGSAYAFCFDGNGNLFYIIVYEDEQGNNMRMRYQIEAIDNRVDESKLNLDLSQYAIEGRDTPSGTAGEANAPSAFTLEDLGFTAGGETTTGQANADHLEQLMNDANETSAYLLLFYDPEYDPSPADAWTGNRGVSLGDTREDVLAAYGDGEAREVPKEHLARYSEYGLEVKTYLVYSVEGNHRFSLIFGFDSDDTVILARYEVIKE